MNPGDGPAIVERKRVEGYRAFKQKIGFGEDTDLGHLRTLRQVLRADERLMVDVNQGWSAEQAVRLAPAMVGFALDWVEEPIVADRPEAEWRACAAAYDVPLAGGENLRGDDLETAARGDALDVIQPDIGKWGGVSGCVAVGRAAVAAGKRYCPHWLSGGVGLMHSAHALAATGGTGCLEVDANDNPLRTTLVAVPALRDGALPIPGTPGIGVEPDLESCGRWLTDRRESH
jgi:L-alanine-DL-glutamate epimerase-like enolase superfamily enzyme